MSKKPNSIQDRNKSSSSGAKKYREVTLDSKIGLHGSISAEQAEDYQAVCVAKFGAAAIGMDGKKAKVVRTWQDYAPAIPSSSRSEDEPLRSGGGGGVSSRTRSNASSSDSSESLSERPIPVREFSEAEKSSWYNQVAKE